MQISASEREGMIRTAKRSIVGFMLLMGLCVWGGVTSETDVLRLLWAVIGATMMMFLKENSDFLSSLLEAEKVEGE